MKLLRDVQREEVKEQGPADRIDEARTDDDPEQARKFVIDFPDARDHVLEKPPDILLEAPYPCGALSPAPAAGAN
jgi:hypothetical protein